MMVKLKDFYHKYDYKINANFILESIIQGIFILFVLLFLFFSGNKDVKAESYQYVYFGSNYISNNVSKKKVSGSTSFDFSFNENVYYKPSISGSLRGSVRVMNLTTELIYSNSIDWEATCTDQLWSTYSGTWPIKDSNTGQFDTYISVTQAQNICNQYKVNGSSIFHQYNVDNHPTLMVYIVGQDGSWNSCVVDSFGMFTCPVVSKNYKGFYVGLYPNGYPSEYEVDISRGFQFIISDASLIIDNQNENSDKVINSIQGEDVNTNDIPDRQDDTLNKQDDLQNSLTSDDIDLDNNVKLNTDAKANTLFWDILTKLINTHEKVVGFIISALSIGLIKLILGR